MDNEIYERELMKTRSNYFSIGSIPCPALNNQLVRFDQQGFRHFLRKKRLMRPIPDQLRRFRLFNKHLISAIKSKDSFISDMSIRDRMKFWSIVKKISRGHQVRIIATKIDNGPLCFLSIMNEKSKNSR